MSNAKCHMGGCTRDANADGKFCDEHKDWKRGTMRPTEVDISNGMLFLMIEDLQRRVRYLETRARYIDMPIGGNS